MEEEIKDKDIELTIDEQAMVELVAEANGIERGKISNRLEIDGKTWKLRPLNKWQCKAMLNHDYDVMYWQRELKSELSRRRAKRLNAKINKAYSKKAAHRILGKRWSLIPFAFLITWLRLYLGNEKITATINAADALGEKQSFCLANLGSSKRALGLSTMQVGNAVKQLQERKASAESMLDEDASPKKEGDSK